MGHQSSIGQVEVEVLPARLVTAVDIARHRVGRRTDPTLTGGLHRMLDYFSALAQARDELARGEWQLPETASHQDRPA